MAKKYYAYLIVNGGVKGITDNWDKCKAITSGTQARYKGFTSEQEAQDWLNAGANYNQNKPEKKETNRQVLPGIYFDSGKRGKNGITFVRVSNEKAEDLMDTAFSSVVDFELFNKALGNLSARRNLSSLNGNVGANLGAENTNNVGELVGFIAASEIAIFKIKNGLDPMTIYGDSQLVLNYWSKGNFQDTLPSKTKKTIALAIEARKKAESVGVRYAHVSGDVNPADLGFHK